MPNLLFSISSGLQTAQGVSSAGPTLAVADTGNNQLAFFNIAGLPGATPDRIGGPGSNPAIEGFRMPNAVTFTAQDEVMVADTQNQHLDHYRKVGPTWIFQNSISLFPGIAPSVGYIIDLVPDGGGNLLFVDMPARRIFRLALATGTVALHYEDPNWLAPSALAVGGGFLWVADASRHQVFRYDAVFGRLSIGGYGAAPGRLRAPRGLAFDANVGTLYVAEAEGARVSFFTTNGQYLGLLGLPLGSPHELHKLALDTVARRLYAADAGANQIHVIDVGGAAGEISIDSQMLNFGSVGVGYYLRLALSVQNGGTNPVQISNVTVQGIDFSLDPMAQVSSFMLQPGAKKQLLIRYAPTASGFAFGRARVETGAVAQPTLFADLVGEGIAVEPMALALVLDRSGSMSLSSGILSKIERLRASCGLLIDLLSPSGADEIAIISFSTNASTDFAHAPLSPSAIATAKNNVAALQAAGATSIGAGLRLGFIELENSLLTKRNVIVLTDGQENTAPMIANITIPSNTNVFTVGIGLPQFLDATLLEKLATSNGGYFQITDGNDLLLSKFFVQIFCDLVGQQVAVDPPFSLQAGQVQDFPVEICSGERELSVISAWENIGSTFEIELVRPDGTVITRSDFGWLAEDARHLAIKLPLRGTRWEQSGRWIARIRALKTTTGLESGVLSVLVSSDYYLNWSFTMILHGRDEVEPPVDVVPNFDLPMIPPQLNSCVPPQGLRVGDRLRLDVSPLFPLTHLAIVSGVIEMRAPTTSLATLKQRYAKIDLDTSKGDPWEKTLDEQPRWTRNRFSVNRRTGSARVEIALDGEDGIYEGRVRIVAVTNGGERLQRERTFYFIASR